MIFYNSHAHDPNPINDEQLVFSPFELKDFLKLQNSHCHFTVGLHPWLTASDQKLDILNLLPKYLDNPRCVGIGEIGFDKNIGSPPLEQQQLVIKQIELARTIQNATIVIHCVKSFDLLYQVIKKYQNDFTFMLHDFNGGPGLVTQFSKLNVFFSLSPRFFKSFGEKKKKTLETIGHDFLLVETDDSNTSIERQTIQLAQAVSMPLSNLNEIIASNFQRCFPRFQVDQVKQSLF
jgi:TatD DNase family protein